MLVFNVLGTPSAKRDVIGKPKGNQLKISVTAAPQRGKTSDYPKIRHGHWMQGVITWFVWRFEKPCCHLAGDE